MTEEKTYRVEKLLLFAGWGDYPELVIEGARKAGVKHITLVAFKGSTSRRVAKLADKVHYQGIGDAIGFFNKLATFDCKHAVLAGQINPLSLFCTKFDSLAMEVLRTIKYRNAHTLFGWFSEKLSKDYGVNVLPASYFMADHIPQVGLLTKLDVSEEEKRDVEFGNKIGMEVCNLDIGQTIVVKDGVVVAVEGIDGTNATIKRCKKICGKGSIVIKVAKAAHDMRFDIPVIGTKTIKEMRKAGARVLSVQAGRTIMLNMPEVIKAADACGVSIVSVESNLPYAPVAK